MDQTPEQRWQRTLLFLQRNVDENIFEMWFQPIRFLSYEAGILRLGFPSDFIKQYIDKNYKNLFLRSISFSFGNNTRLAYVYNIGDEISQTIDENETSVAAAQTRPRIVSPIDSNIDGVEFNDLDPRLDPRYTFSSFLQGECNSFARTMGLTIAEKYQDTLNPYFVFGHSGVGKTHLVNAIGHRIKELYPNRRVLYISCALFSQRLTEAILAKKFNDFMNFCYSIETLIIDDVQEIAGKEKTQVALFNIFNHMMMNRRQIIFTCDRPPKMLEGLEERLLTRFKGGLVIELQRPDTQLRRDIVKRRVETNGLPFPADVMEYIATRVQNNVREIEGAINSIMAFAVAGGREIDLNLAKATLAHTVQVRREPATLNQIMGVVSHYYKVSLKDIDSTSRKSNVAQARKVAMYLVKKYTDLSSAQIGKGIGHRDHATVLYSCNDVKSRLAMDATFRNEIESMEREIENL